MKVTDFPYLAVAAGVLFMLLVVTGGTPDSDGKTAMPLLTLLVVCEFAFFVTAIGGIIGMRNFRATPKRAQYLVATLFSLLLALAFAWMGINYWPH